MANRPGTLPFAEPVPEWPPRPNAVTPQARLRPSGGRPALNPPPPANAGGGVAGPSGTSNVTPLPSQSPSGALSPNTKKKNELKQLREQYWQILNALGSWLLNNQQPEHAVMRKIIEEYNEEVVRDVSNSMTESLDDQIATYERHLPFLKANLANVYEYSDLPGRTEHAVKEELIMVAEKTIVVLRELFAQRIDDVALELISAIEAADVAKRTQQTVEAVQGALLALKNALRVATDELKKNASPAMAPGYQPR